MDDHDKGRHTKSPTVEDDATSSGSPLRSSSEEGPAGSVEPSVGGDPDEVTEEVGENYLEDLRRVQADFENYRKRMLREQTHLAQRASARLVERLLPVLDNFESAIAHGEGGAGVEMVYRELRRLLEEEGLGEIDAEGQPFDPMKHEAFEAVEDESVEQPTVRSVLRRGYTLKDQVLRPSMVSVARPPDEPELDQTDEDERDSSEPDAAEG